jgi:hypothetical protein
MLRRSGSWPATTGGGLPPGLHHRLQACLLHIGLDAMAYNAYRGPERFDDLARTASQISELL